MQAICGEVTLSQIDYQNCLFATPKFSIMNYSYILKRTVTATVHRTVTAGIKFIV